MRLYSTATIINRHWAKVQKGTGPDDCWLWTGPMLKNGYGVANYRDNVGKWHKTSAHRVTWIIVNGPIPDGQDVCHDCDVRYPAGDFAYRRCLNPAHLFLGTPAANSADMIAKERYWTKKRREGYAKGATTRGSRRVQMQCKQCGCTFAIFPSRVGRRLYCSKDCKAANERKLTPEQMEEVHRRYQAGEHRRTIASEFGLSKQHLWAIGTKSPWH